MRSPLRATQWLSDYYKGPACESDTGAQGLLQSPEQIFGRKPDGRRSQGAWHRGQFYSDLLKLVLAPYADYVAAWDVYAGKLSRRHEPEHGDHATDDDAKQRILDLEVQLIAFRILKDAFDGAGNARSPKGADAPYVLFCLRRELDVVVHLASRGGL